MHYFNPRMTSFLLVFGIFFTLSCATTNSSNNLESSDQPTVEELQDRLTQLDNRLQNDVQNSSLTIEKASLLSEIAEKTEPPSQRLPYYRNLRDMADANYSDQNVRQEIDHYVQTSWTFEQTEGVKLLQQNPSGMDEQLTDEVISHFKNAITVNPDSLTTYNLLANTFYRSNRYDQAIQTLESALENIEPDPSEIREKLAYLYLESGNIDTSIRIYEDLVEDYPERAQIRHGLANAYMLNNEHDFAISILRNLIEDYPNRIEYKESLAGELYFKFRSSALRYINSDETISEADRDELLQKLDEITSLYNEIDSTVPLSDDNAYRKAAYLKNSAGYLADLSSNSTGNQFEEYRIELLNSSMVLWERLSENNPDNISYIRNLYDVYVELGMTEEAESIKRSYNL
ncbi:tetratricopeptide repeat protein [Rhodohalobacter sp.]|uniref:tetratricopeptide repeat protein n=1 Tax=Rhodohalobacter sp. TaxID=1974210 RepID=UPI002ACECBFB|nr:tetratricopeptide repeat protein [Rhodohalobacter sp.]MDZ7757921.1 tetratricopeptide repeat protein [Rhodohalobacter sp.]